MSKPFRLRLSLVLSLGALLLLSTPGVAADSPKGWHHLQNEHLKLGINFDAGACIGWISTSEKLEKNLLNTYDPGRYVQQSYYGNEDGSDWNGKPWRYNPVQGGEWRGTPSKVLEFRAESPTTLYSKTQPRHWANGKSLDEVTMEQWITLEGPVARVRFRMTYSGSISHKPYHQELPAFFVQPEFDTLVYCQDKPWKNAPVSRLQPGEKNEYVKLTEPWTAWVNAEGFGIAVLSPGCDLATCYRVPGPAACSYVAPLQTFALTPGLQFDHTVIITTGTVEAMRKRFADLVKK